MAAVVPRLLKHARATPSATDGLRAEGSAWQAQAAGAWPPELADPAVEPAADPKASLDVLEPAGCAFERTTTADKFIYEAELRTGAGAHYRYARHLHDALECW